jgi:aryl-alcohol dehydrogenase-like predicted oxidoreductase
MPEATDPMRRRLLRGCAYAAALASFGGAPPAWSEPLLQRKVPRDGATLPVIGLGTWQTFDVGDAATDRQPLQEVLQRFAALGGRLVDTSPMYGRAEAVLGEVERATGLEKTLFHATKVWTTGREAGIRQMEESFRLLNGHVELMQVHNLVDWRTHAETLRAWQAEGRLRYLGITHYTAGAYAELEQVMRALRPDFVQLNYSVVSREAEQVLLPLARDLGCAVLVNRPFEGAALFERVRGRALPGFAAEIGCTSWAQLMLKFVVAHPAVTCAIPATSKLRHLEDNMRAGLGALPDTALRERIAEAVATR